MGNCWAKFRKNKVGPDPRIMNEEKMSRDISEILSIGSASLSCSSLSNRSELKMIEELGNPDVDTTRVSLESVVLGKEIAAMEEIQVDAHVPAFKKPVFFQVDFVQGMHSMPPRLASRMEQKRNEQTRLTDEDEILMDEIMEEFDTQEKLKKLQDQLRAADSLRKQHLETIREKARGMRSRPPTRAGGHHVAHGPVVKKPVFFQVDFVQGMHSMPSRLASRMELKRNEQMRLTDEDEILMDEIMEEFEAQEKLKKLQDQLRAADLLRKQHLESIREKARGMRSRPQTRAGGHHMGGERG